MDRQSLWNWTKAALGLRNVRNALQTLVVDHVTTFYNALQCRQPNRICQCNQKSMANTKPNRGNPCPTCQNIHQSLIDNTIGRKPMISNCKVKDWRTNEWEVAKAFILGVGYKDIDSADKTDVSGMISICLNAEFIQRGLIQSDLDAFKKVRDIRNEVFHSSTMNISTVDFEAYIKTMLNMLDDRLAKSDDILKGFQTAKEALRKLPQEPLCEHCIEQIDCYKDALVALNVDATQLIKELEQPQTNADRLQTQEKLADIFKTQNVHSMRIDCQEQKMDKTMHTLSAIPIHQKETVKIRAQIKDSLAKQGIAMHPKLCEALKHDVKIFQPKQLFQNAPTKQDDRDKDELIFEKLKDIQQSQNEIKLEMSNLKETVNNIQNKNQEATDDNLNIHQDDNDPNYGSNSKTDTQTSNASYDQINETAFPKPESHEADTDKATPDKDIDNNSHETVSDLPGSVVDIARTENDTEQNTIGTEADSNGEDSDQAEIYPGDDDINVLAESMTGIMSNVSDLPGNDVDIARTENDTENNPSGTEPDSIGEDSDQAEIHPGDDDINVPAGSGTEIMSNVSDLPGNNVDIARTENDTENNPSGTEPDSIGEDSDQAEIHPGDDDINVPAGSGTAIMSNEQASALSLPMTNACNEDTIGAKSPDFDVLKFSKGFDIKLDRRRPIIGIAQLTRTTVVIITTIPVIGILSLVDLSTRKVTSELELSGLIWDVTTISDNLVAVTITFDQTVLIVSVAETSPGTFTMRKTNEINMAGDCYGIDYRNDKLAVTFIKYNYLKQGRQTGVLVMNMSGEVEYDISSNDSIKIQGQFGYVKFAPSGQELFVTCEDDAVRKISLTGDVLACYRDRNLRNPRGLVMTTAGELFVCGYYNETIYVVGKDEVMRIVLTKEDGIERPLSLCLCEDMNKLCVGTTLGKVAVFKMFLEN